MRRQRFGWLRLTALLSAMLPLGNARGRELPSGLRVKTSTQPLLLKHCGACHGPEDAHAGVRIDTLPAVIDSPEAARRWQQVLGVLNSGEMPPDDKPQLDPTAKTELLDDLAQALVVARKTLADTGNAITMRRLNRREYVNTMQELLGVTIEPRGLPADGGAGTFDTVGSGLFISADQIEQYHEIALVAIEEAWKRYGVPHPSRILRMEAEVTTPGVRSRLALRIDDRRRFVLWEKAVESAAGKPENRAAVAEIRGQAKPGQQHPLLESWEKLQGAPSPTLFQFSDAVNAIEMGSRDWVHRVPYHTLYASHPAVERGAFLGLNDPNVNAFLHFSVPGDWPLGAYVLRLRVAAIEDSPSDRRFMEFGPWGREDGPRGCHEITGTMPEPQILEIPIVTQGGRVFVFQEKGSRDSDEQSHRKFFDALQANGIGPSLVIWVDWIELEGPVAAMQRAPAGLAELLSVPVAEQAGATKESAERDLRGVLERFCLRAFRGRNPEQSFVDKLVAIYERERAGGRPFREAVTESLAVVLSSPHFLYLAEPTTVDGRRQLDGLELANRMSYFLWSGPPDDELLSLAETGELHKSDVLRDQVDRMIDDPKSRRFATAFTHQWFGVDRLDFFQFKHSLYPRYDLATKAASRQEIFETLAIVLKENLSVRNLLTSDFVVVNSLMARYYGLEGVHGDDYQMVKLPEGSPRGGLLGMAAVLAMGSNGEHTSPVERGAWVLRKLLHDPPPPAPPNVPQLTRLEGQLLTTRERMLAHQQEPQCASCHRKIDPIGFGLENFDAVGMWRTRDSYKKDGIGTKEWEIDPAGAFHNGPAFKDYFELRDLVAQRHAEFAAGFTEALLSYALGRPVGFSDDELVKKILASAAENDYGTRGFIHAIVASPAFQQK